MKVAAKVILLLNSSDGLSAAISGGICPSANSKSQVIKESFELPLDGYGVKYQKVSGEIINYTNADGHNEAFTLDSLWRLCHEIPILFGGNDFDHIIVWRAGKEVSILLLQNYEPPILACAVNEVLLKLTDDDSSTMPTLIVPTIVPASKLKPENKYSAKSDEVLIYGVKLGPTTDVTESLSSKFPKPPPFLQIYREDLATLLHLVNVMKLPTVVMLGVNGQGIEQLEVVSQIREHLSNVLSISFSKDKKSVQNPTKVSRDKEEAWRALYG